MTIAFSPSGNGGVGSFYDDTDQHKDLPADLIPITSEKHAELLAAINLRAAKVSVVNDEITIVETSGPTAADLMKLLRRHRDHRLSETDFSADTPKAVVAKFKDYRQALRDWPATVKDPMNPPPFPAKPE